MTRDYHDYLIMRARLVLARMGLTQVEIQKELSALDTEAISLLNEVPREVNNAINFLNGKRRE